MTPAKLRRYWLFQLVGWGSFALINLFFAYLFNVFVKQAEVEPFLGRLGVYVVLGIFCTHLMRHLIIKLNILQKSFDKQVLQFFVITCVFTLLLSYIDIQLIAAYGWLKATEKTLFTNNLFLLILSNGFYCFILLFIWNLIYFIYHYVTKSRKQQLDTLQLEAMVRVLELKTIKAHINPHFIFNALNSIRALIDENPDRARKAVTELSNILRSSLKVEKGETVLFSDELKIVKDYLALENMRFEDRLTVEYEVDEDTLEQQIPPMMLQTLVENAIKHGISQQVKGGLIKITSDFKDDYHLLSVQNTGHLNGRANKDGFGLSSTHDRLQLLFGARATFELRQLDSTLVEAKVMIPVLLN
ncbi:MAG: histidine kinase [Chitinophagaceae bacterium]